MPSLTMRPEPVQNRPFFRPEAENYRRLRHLGDIILFRPLSLRLVTLYPVVVVALLVLAMSRLDFRKKSVALVEEVSPQGAQVRLSLDPGAAGSLRRGDQLELRFVGSEQRWHGSILELTMEPCSHLAQAFLLSSSRAAPRSCLRITVDAPEARGVGPGGFPATVEFWSPPQKYLAHLLG